MLKLKFSHHYPKLHCQTEAELIAVRLMNAASIQPELIEYDTVWRDGDGGPSGRYNLPEGLVLILYFVGEKGIPFCTIRRATGRKHLYYEKSVGQQFQVLVVPEVPKTDPNQTNLGIDKKDPS